MTRPFKHLIVTRFNINLYSPSAKLRVSPEQWMAHPLELFTSFTLPSIASQSCQDFTWLIAMDPRTPDVTMQTLERLCPTNMKLFIPAAHENSWLRDLEPGAYDLLTTRIDNDDAFHRETVAALHETYRAHRDQQARPWVMAFPLGLIMDLDSRQAWMMEYWTNNSPTLVEDGRDPQTVWQWQHDHIPTDVPRCYIKDKPYWLQVVHTQNLRNAIRSSNPFRKVHTELPARPEHLTHFGVDPDRLPAA